MAQSDVSKALEVEAPRSFGGLLLLAVALILFTRKAQASGPGGHWVRAWMREPSPFPMWAICGFLIMRKNRNKLFDRVSRRRACRPWPLSSA